MPGLAKFIGFIVAAKFSETVGLGQLHPRGQFFRKVVDEDLVQNTKTAFGVARFSTRTRRDERELDLRNRIQPLQRNAFNEPQRLFSTPEPSLGVSLERHVRVIVAHPAIGTELTECF